MSGKVNFAGHFILTGWGCGTGCISGAIIDARNGRVYFPDELAAMGTFYSEQDGYDDELLRYRATSRLLILKGVPGSRADTDPPRPQGTYYFEWLGTRFRLLRSVEGPK
jgi:hypothetical protein